jgi:hypothetical protein
MFNFILRVASLAAFSVALIAAVLDVTRSIADKRTVMTPLRSDWLQYSPDTYAIARETIITRIHEFVWSPVIETFLAIPTFVAFGGLALLFALAVRSRRRRWQESFNA